MSFALAIYSIHEQYMGALACWTVSIAPLDAALSIVLKAVVAKNQAENTSHEGDGIRDRQLIHEMEGVEDNERATVKPC